MKIIARKDSDTVLVEMGDEEFARAAGFYSHRSAGEVFPGTVDRDGFRVGAVIQVSEMYRKLTAMRDQEKKLVDAAGMLRTMADMMTAALPEVLVAPPQPEIERCVPKKVPE